MSLRNPHQKQNTVVRTYKMGIRFEGNRKERRAQEKEANQRVKGLQFQQEKIIHDKNAINAAMGIARMFPNKQSKLAIRAIQETTKNYSNIAAVE